MTPWQKAFSLAGFLLACRASPDAAEAQPPTQPQPQPATAGSSGSASEQLEQFANLRLPASGRDVSVIGEKNTAGDPVYRAHFTTSEADARAFCSQGGLGGALVRSQPLDEPTRSRFGLSSDETSAAFGCKASNPADRRVERQVLVTLPAAGQARVHVVAFRTPAR